MLILLFYVGRERYALDCSQLVETIPMVNLRPIPQAPSYVAGSFLYRGAIVPAIDISQIIQGTSSRSYLSTRIIILNLRKFQGNFKDSRDSDLEPIVGMIAERVTETLNISATDMLPPVLPANSAPYLGDTIVDRAGMIQLIKFEEVLANSDYGYLMNMNHL